MYLTFTLVALGLVLAIVFIRDYFQDERRHHKSFSRREEASAELFDKMVSAGIALVLVGIITSVVVSQVTPNSVKIVEDEHGLKALTNTSESSGYFFLLGGSFDNENVYRYIAVNDRGGSSLEEIDADRVTIYEDATPETAHRAGRVIMRQPYSPWSWWQTADLGDNWEVEFHVPPGTVKSEFDVSVSN